MNEDFVKSISDRYIELYENITGDTFIKADINDVMNRIEKNVSEYIKSL